MADTLTKTDLGSMTRAELDDYIRIIGESRFRAAQIAEWLRRGVDFDGMSNLPAPLRARLAETCTSGIPGIERKLVFFKHQRREAVVLFAFPLQHALGHFLANPQLRAAPAQLFHALAAQPVRMQKQPLHRAGTTVQQRVARVQTQTVAVIGALVVGLKLRHEIPPRTVSVRLYYTSAAGNKQLYLRDFRAETGK